MKKKRAGEIGGNYATLLNISKSKKDLNGLCHGSPFHFV